MITRDRLLRAIAQAPQSAASPRQAPSPESNPSDGGARENLPAHDVWSPAPRAWWTLVASAAIVSVLALIVSGNGQLGLGLGIFFFLVLLPLRFPVEAVFVILAIGWFPFEVLFGWEHSLLTFVGGINVSGLRLLGAFLGLLIVVFLYRRRLLEVTLPRPIRVGLLLYAAFLAWGLLTLLWTPDKIDGLRLATKLAFPVLVAAVVVADPRGWGAATMTRRIFWLLAAMLAVATVFGFLGILPADEPGGISPIWGWAGRVAYAIFAGIVAILAVALIDNGFVRRTVWPLALAVVQLPYTVSRIALAGTGIAISWMLGTSGVHRVAAPISIVLVAALFLFFPPIHSRSFYENRAAAVKDVGANPSEVESTVKLEGRGQLWSKAISLMSPADYAVGNGLNAWWTRSLATYEGNGSSELHGEYVRLLYETGIAGLALFLAAYLALTVGFIRLALRTARRTLGRAAATAAVGLIAVYLLTATTDNLLDYYPIGAYVWVGLALAILHAKESKRTPTPARS